MASLLRLDAIVKHYRIGVRGVRALDGISLEVAAGEIVVVSGPSGSGKTTMLLAAGGLLGPDEGAVLIEGRSLYRSSPSERARERCSTIGFVFQQFHLIPYLTVLENVLAPTLARPLDGAGEQAHELIDRLQLAEREDHLPAELSTGERQRVALARALLPGPRLLLADEPTGNLDPENAALVMDEIQAFAARGGAVLVVTHATGAIDGVTRRLRLTAGRITATNGTSPPAEH